MIIPAAIFAPFITSYTIDKINPQDALLCPSLDHPFGTDYLGRNIYTRMIYGARPMLIVGLFTQIIALIIGTTLGLLSGYLGGVVDWM